MSNTENINIIEENSSTLDKWSPKHGEETEKLLDKLFAKDRVSKQKVISETYDILKMCGDPTNKENKNTGLVLGYVQSGKTLSFTALAAMARDNNYRIVIIIAGIATNLIDQTYDRLLKDLSVNDSFVRRWTMLKNPGRKSLIKEKRIIKEELQKWEIPGTPDSDKKTLLITVMKQKNNLPNLISLLREINLVGAPTLIIDDEGDQASLNTRARQNANNQEQRRSTIYRELGALRNIFPHHTYVQYTATPQALLFINISDNLSPNFVQLLTPGEKYTGGQAFCKDNKYLIRTIPHEDIIRDDHDFDEIPDSLQEALCIFFLSVSIGRKLGDDKGNPKNRSMMIHPSQYRDGHDRYYDWVRTTKANWEKVMLDKDRVEYRLEIIQKYEKAYEDLKVSLSEIPSFETLIQDLPYSMKDTSIQILNSEYGSEVDWNSNYSTILIGGQAMNRGFTVEGLTVTYMPRPAGVGNADTIQQRGRFFGYKKDYLGHCRVYLDLQNKHLFESYVDHEEDVRRKLLSSKKLGQPLNEMKRRFLLDEMFSLTRNNVLSDPTERKSIGSKWDSLKVPHDSEKMIKTNRKVYDDFVKKFGAQFSEDKGDNDRTDDQRHYVVKISIKDLFKNLFNDFKFTNYEDLENMAIIREVIFKHKEKYPMEESFVYLMRKGKMRERSLNSKDHIKAYFQGRNNKGDRVVYPGDKSIKMKDSITIQLMNLDIKDTDYKNVISMAVWIPQKMAQSFISKGSDNEIS